MENLIYKAFLEAFKSSVEDESVISVQTFILNNGINSFFNDLDLKSDDSFLEKQAYSFIHALPEFDNDFDEAFDYAMNDVQKELNKIEKLESVVIKLKELNENFEIDDEDFEEIEEKLKSVISEIKDSEYVESVFGSSSKPWKNENNEERRFIVGNKKEQEKEKELERLDLEMYNLFFKNEDLEEVYVAYIADQKELNEKIFYPDNYEKINKKLDNEKDKKIEEYRNLLSRYLDLTEIDNDDEIPF